MNTNTTTQTTVLLFAAILLALTGCSSPAPAEPASSEPAPAAAAPTTAPAAMPLEVDVVAAVEDELGTDVEWTTGIEQTEAGRITISTDLVDDQTENSADGMRAMALCNGAARVDGVTYVSVLEADGTSWVLYGHPLVPEGECGEV